MELAKNGPLVAMTGPHTGRSPNDKFTVEESTSADAIWWGKVNRPFPENQFDALKARQAEHEAALARWDELETLQRELAGN